MSWNGQISDIVSVCFVMKCSSPRHSISLCCQQTDTMSEIGSFHDITDWYYVWGLTISWQNSLILFLGLDHFMPKQTDTMSEMWIFHDKTDWYYSGAWSFHDKTDWYYVWGLTILWQNGQAPDIVSVCVVMKCSSPRYSISLFRHEIFTSQA
jgi:hypothetical protein